MSGKPNDKLMKTLAKKHGSDEAARAYGAVGGRISRRTKRVHG